MIKKILGVTALTVVSLSALAATETWDFTNSNGNSNVYIGQNTPLSVTVNGFSIANSSTDLSTATSATVTHNSWGLLVENSRDTDSAQFYGNSYWVPDHAIDSFNGRTDFISFDFNYNVSLDGMDLGWTKEYFYSQGYVRSADTADLTIWNKNESGTWTALANLADLNASYHNLTAYQNTLGSSSSWAISAYNANYGGTNLYGTSGLNDSHGWDIKGDAFKLKGLTVSFEQPSGKGEGKVPEPASFALLGLGLYMLRRGRKK
ncbi:PEP-CTERM sorting domain-containing protein [Bowmanella sp. JS7-9]|uniref:PEP-CTERM sorting domain-containing protein n=1 Tax=Pseudobowmanella zhangzhouensis TaxID=1537679 RepID=A0ABW1XIS0_9ALTE|nr:PEP-CTERM sorting domain-containing protein [Bowmanella sp. JS7-9]TBX21020.1 hypothetical protein TK45_13195 [Bowmanella sp. JS7-9]